MFGSPKRAIAVPLSLALFLPSGAPGGPDDPRHAPCRRAAPLPFAPGEIVEIPDAEAPCRVEVRETGVRLLSVEDGSRPDPGFVVVRDGRGRFYSTGAFGFGNEITLWDEKGNFLKSFGRSGDGPGEFSSRGMISVYVDDEDKLHVRDGGPNWSVFSPDQEFLSRVTATGMASSGLTEILDGGMAVTISMDGVHYFRTMDSTGATHRSFGVIPEELRRAQAGELDRRIAYSGGDGFWAAPIARGPDGYQLEEWGTDGELRRGFRRTVDWFPPGEPARRPDDDQPPREFDFLHIDDSGLLYVGIVRATDKWRSRASLKRRPTEEELDEMFEGILEVIDVRSGRLLVSERGLKRSQALALLPHGFFRGSKEGFRYRQGENYGFTWPLRELEEGEDPRNLLPVVEIVSVELVAK